MLDIQSAKDVFADLATLSVEEIYAGEDMGVPFDGFASDDHEASMGNHFEDRSQSVACPPGANGGSHPMAGNTTIYQSPCTRYDSTSYHGQGTMLGESEMNPYSSNYGDANAFGLPEGGAEPEQFDRRYALSTELSRLEAELCRVKTDLNVARVDLQGALGQRDGGGFQSDSFNNEYMMTIMSPATPCMSPMPSPLFAAPFARQAPVRAARSQSPTSILRKVHVYAPVAIPMGSRQHVSSQPVARPVRVPPSPGVSSVPVQWHEFPGSLASPRSITPRHIHEGGASVSIPPPAPRTTSLSQGSGTFSPLLSAPRQIPPYQVVFGADGRASRVSRMTTPPAFSGSLNLPPYSHGVLSVPHGGSLTMPAMTPIMQPLNMGQQQTTHPGYQYGN